MKCEHALAARLPIEAVGEEGLDAGALIEKRQGAAPRGHRCGQSDAVLAGLRLDAAEGRALRLGLDGADGLAMDE
jgi:hypothetical protein